MEIGIGFQDARLVLRRMTVRGRGRLEIQERAKDIILAFDRSSQNVYLDNVGDRGKMQIWCFPLGLRERVQSEASGGRTSCN